MAKGADDDFDVDVHQCHACVAKLSKANAWKGDNAGAIYFLPRHIESAS